MQFWDNLVSIFFQYIFLQNSSFLWSLNFILFLIGPYYRKFIQHKFLSTDRQNKNKNKDSKRVYPFETTATDTELVKNLFVAVTEIIMNINLGQAGLQ